MKIQQWFRLLRVIYIWNRFGLEDLFHAKSRFRAAHFLFKLNPLKWLLRVDRTYTRGERLCLALQALGPIYVKIGQILSLRQDVLPHDVVKALTKLQDQVDPFATDLAKQAIENAFDLPLGSLFDDFSSQPLASASVAQVHSARLKTGEEVVVKVLRPGIEKVLKKDIALIYQLAYLMKKVFKGSHRLHPVEVAQELEFNLLQELDLEREAANACQLKRNTSNSHWVQVPEVYWPFCSTQVMTMERVYGMSVLDIDALQKRGVNLRLLAERGVKMFYSQVFNDRFFHADMHPGNLFVDATNPQDPSYHVIDFGIMGTLSEADQYYLAANMLAFFDRDYHQVARLHVESRWVPADTRIEALESAIRTVCEPIFNKPLHQISFGKTLMGLFKVARQYQVDLQPQLLLLQKTIMNMEALARRLYPDLDLWETGKPFLKRWMKESLGYRGAIKKIRKTWPRWGQQLLDMPDLFTHLMHDKSTPPSPSRRRDSGHDKHIGIWQFAGWVLVIAALLIVVFPRHMHDLLNWALHNPLGVFVLGVVCALLAFIRGKGPWQA